MGRSYTFSTDKAGYAQALAQIDAITAQGHQVGGDVSRVYAFFGR